MPAHALPLNDRQRVNLTALKADIDRAQHAWNLYATAVLDAANVVATSVNVNLASGMIEWTTDDERQLSLVAERPEQAGSA